MPLDKPLDEVGPDDLQALLDGKVSESQFLDYKADLTATASNEILLDTTAFANTLGGHIIFGMTEEGTFPTGIVGLPVIDRDMLKQRIHNQLRDTVRPPLNAVQFKDVEFDDGRWCLVMRIPGSWLRPHAVPVKGGLGFHMRNSVGNYPLDVAGLRSAFNLSAATRERIRDFRAQRLSAILAGDTPMPVGDGPKVVTHLLPIGSFETDIEVLLRTLAEAQQRRPDNHHWLTGLYRYNLDGVVFHTSNSRNLSEGRITDYIQLFTSGAVEIVESRGFSRRNEISGREFDCLWSKVVQAGIGLQQQAGVGFPVFVFTTFIGFRGSYLLRGVDGSAVAIDRDIIATPDVRIDSPSVEITEAIRPILDAWWRAGGWPGSASYAPDGTWLGWPG